MWGSLRLAKGVTGREGYRMVWESVELERRRPKMKLSAPQKGTWWIALIVGVLGIVSYLVTVPVLSGFAFWLVAAAFVLLILATYLKGL